MAPETRAHDSKTSNLKRSADHIDTTNNESAHPKAIQQRSRGPVQKSKQTSHNSSVSETDIPTEEQPSSQAQESMEQKLPLNLLNYVKKRISETHASLNPQAKHDTAREVIAKEFKPYQNLIISEYAQFAVRNAEDRKGNKSSAKGKQLGLPLDGDTDNMASSEPANEEKGDDNLSVHGKRNLRGRFVKKTESGRSTRSMTTAARKEYDSKAKAKPSEMPPDGNTNNLATAGPAGEQQEGNIISD